MRYTKTMPLISGRQRQGDLHDYAHDRREGSRRARQDVREGHSEDRDQGQGDRRPLTETHSAGKRPGT